MLLIYMDGNGLLMPDDGGRICVPKPTGLYNRILILQLVQCISLPQCSKVRFQIIDDSPWRERFGAVSSYTRLAQQSADFLALH